MYRVESFNDRRVKQTEIKKRHVFQFQLLLLNNRIYWTRTEANAKCCGHFLYCLTINFNQTRGELVIYSNNPLTDLVLQIIT